MDYYNTSDSDFNIFDSSLIDSYNFDVDPDLHFFSSFDTTNLCRFYDETQFNDLYVSMPSNIFSTFHLNIRSLPCNYDKFIHYLSLLKHNFSVIALSETWLTEDSREIFKLPNYNSVHYVRENRSGGGVSLFFLDNYEFKVRDDLSLNSVESVFVELSGVFGGKNVHSWCHISVTRFCCQRF